MANLETLELTLQGNAEEATQGIGGLIRSLSALSSAIAKPVNGLMKLNEQLAKLKSYGSMRMPNVGNMTGATSAGRAASAKKPGTYALDPSHINGVNNIDVSKLTFPNAKPEAQWQKEYQANLAAEKARREAQRAANVAARQRMANEAKAAAEATKRRGQEAISMLETSSKAELLTKKLNAAKEAFVNNAAAGKMTSEQMASGALKIKQMETQLAKLGQETVPAGEKIKTFGEKFSGAFSKIKRIASTMVTRLALRALIKNFTEAWNSAYQFSKNMGGSFAENVDKVKNSLASMAVNIVRAFSPLMSVVAPIFSVIATGINYLTQAISKLLNLLGITSELLGASADKIASAGSATKKTSNDVLASFDELNVINNASGGGSGSGSGGSSFSASFAEEIESIKMIVAESLLAVGLLLAFSGHVGIGLALAAIGAATIVGTIVEKWGTLSNQVKGEITTIMGLAGASMLAIGSIIAFSGANVPLGIALMAVGTANLVAAASLSWNLDSTVKKKIGNIAGITGTGMLAIGAVLAFSGANIPLGIGMMVAGGVSLASAIALNWETLKTSIINTFNDIGEKISSAWEKVKEKTGEAWDKYMQWTGVSWADMSAAWDNIKKNLPAVWETVKLKIYEAWGNVKTWMNAKWASFKSGWETVKNGLGGIWENIESRVSFAWNEVCNWIEATWTNFSLGWEDIKSKLVGVWDSIKNAVYYAWGNVKNWISARWSDFSRAWGDIKENLGRLWGSIKTNVSDAWDKVKQWIQIKASEFNSWDDVKKKLGDAWASIQSSISDAWNKLKDWYKTSSGSAIYKIKSAWLDVKTWFNTNVTTPIGNFFKACINVVIDAMNWVINKLNELGHIHWDAVYVLGVEVIPAVDTRLFKIPNISRLETGAYDIPKGQLFIANEAGAEMVGSLDGKTTVANQEQIIEGIRRGISDANSEQNRLLIRQNEILLGILQKEGNVNIGPSSAFGRVAKQSIRMYEGMTGV